MVFLFIVFLTTLLFTKHKKKLYTDPGPTQQGIIYGGDSGVIFTGDSQGRWVRIIAITADSNSIRVLTKREYEFWYKALNDSMKKYGYIIKGSTYNEAEQRRAIDSFILNPRK